MSKRAFGPAMQGRDGGSVPARRITSVIRQAAVSLQKVVVGAWGAAPVTAIQRGGAEPVTGTAACGADRGAVDGVRLLRYLSTGRGRRDLWAASRVSVARIGASTSSAWAEVAVDMRGL